MAPGAVRALARPGRPGKGVIVLAMLIVAFMGISTTTGTGWPIVLVALLIGTLLVAFALPGVPLWPATLSLRTPGDTVAGLPVTVDVTSTSSAVVKACAPALDRGWFRLGTGQLVVVPTRRGVIETVRVELRCSFPLGLWSWRKRVWVPLERPLHVAPVPLAAELRLPPDTMHRGDELTRGVRPYEAGDALRHVHWPATARSGALQVREREDDERTYVDLVVHLGAPGELSEALVEHRAGWAAGAGVALLSTGRQVVVHTHEPAGPMSGLVRDRRELGRRLARALPGDVNVPRGALVVDVAAEAGEP